MNDVMKSLATFFLFLSLIFSSFLSIPPKKAEAFLGDSVSGTAQLAMMVADTLARAAAQAVLQRMIDSTVEWASSGFEGNPAYVTNPKQFFTDIADGVAGEFIAGSDLSFLCSPFQTQIRLALRTRYTQSDDRFQCTLTNVVGNIEEFYKDFNQGGWDAWFSMTQNSANNPYGAYLGAQLELDSRIASAVNLQKEQLDWNQGFLSWSECIKTDPDTGECIERGPTKTPGSTIKSQLEKVIPSTMDRFINAQHLEDLIGAFVTGALNRYVFGSQGLFSNDPPPPMPAPVISGSAPTPSTASTTPNLFLGIYGVPGLISISPAIGATNIPIFASSLTEPAPDGIIYPTQFLKPVAEEPNAACQFNLTGSLSSQSGQPGPRNESMFMCGTCAFTSLSCTGGAYSSCNITTVQTTYPSCP